MASNRELTETNAIADQPRRLGSFEDNRPVFKAPPKVEEVRPVATSTDRLMNYIQTGGGGGSATGSATGTTPTQENLATLINNTSGDKRVVEVGSAEAQELFGQGYELMGSGVQESSTPSVEGSTTAPVVPEPSSITQAAPSVGSIDWLRKKSNATRSEMFSLVYGYTPDEIQDLPPSEQRYLRNLRVQGLKAELGNWQDAIEVARQEDLDARSTNLEKLNLYLKYGVLNELEDSELQGLAASVGLSADAVRAMGVEGIEPPELRSVNGNLYQLQFNPESGTWESSLIIGKSSGGGGGGGGGSSYTQYSDDLVSEALNAYELSGNSIVNLDEEDIANIVSVYSARLSGSEGETVFTPKGGGDSGPLQFGDESGEGDGPITFEEENKSGGGNKLIDFLLNKVF
jgi:hypothetical protein